MALLTRVLLLSCVFQLSIADNLVELTSSNFASTVAEGPWFVKFYAPWCGHCKKLAPKFAAAAEDMENKVSFANVDVSQYTDLKKQYDVAGFPTLIFFENGEQVLKYNGVRDEENMKLFCNKMLQSPLELVDTVSDVKKMFTTNTSFRNIKNSPVTFILGLDSKAEYDGKAFKLMEEISRKKRSTHFFYATASNEVRDYVCPSCKTPFLVRSAPDEKPMVFPASLSSENKESIASWIERYSFPHFQDLNYHFFNMMAAAVNQSLVIAIYDPETQLDAETQSMLDAFKVNALPGSTLLSKEAQQKFLFGKLDGEKFNIFVEDYDIERKELPRVLVLDSANQLYYKDKEAEKELINYLESIAQGKIAAYSDGFWKMPSRLKRKYNKNLPYSAVILVATLGFLGAFFYLICWADFDDYDSDDEDDVVTIDRMKTQKSRKETKKNK